MTTESLNEKKIVLVFAFVWGLTFMNRLSINFAMPIIQESLNISGADIGIVVFASTLIMAISAIIVGIISDRQGKRKKFLAMAAITVGIGSVLSLFATSFTTFVLSRILVGIGLGPILGMIFAITEKISSENRLGANTGVIMSGGAFLATILGPLAITQLASVMSWQMTLALTGIPTIIIGLIVAKYVPETKQESKDSEAVKASPIEIFKYPNIFQCIFLAILTLGAYFAIVTYAPLYLIEVANVDLGTMGMIAATMGIVTICYTFIVPRSTDKFGRKPVLILVCIACALGPILMYLFTGSFIGIGGFVLFGGLSASVHVFFNTIIPMEGLPNNLKTSGSAILMALSEVFGSGAVPLLTGILADDYGYASAMLFAGALFIIAFLISFTLKESNKSFKN